MSKPALGPEWRRFYFSMQPQIDLLPVPPPSPPTLALVLQFLPGPIGITNPKPAMFIPFTVRTVPHGTVVNNFQNLRVQNIAVVCDTPKHTLTKYSSAPTQPFIRGGRPVRLFPGQFVTLVTIRACHFRCPPSQAET